MNNERHNVVFKEELQQHIKLILHTCDTLQNSLSIKANINDVISIIDTKASQPSFSNLLFIPFNSHNPLLKIQKVSKMSTILS